MDEYNGMSVALNDEQNAFLGSLFPDMQTNVQSAITPDSSTNGFTGYKWQYLKRSLNDIQNDFFSFIAPQIFGNVTVIQHPGTKISFDLKEFIVYRESNGQAGYQDGDTLLCKIKIFVFTQGELVLQAYNEAQPDDNEAAFFIEDNTGDTSTAKLYAKFGVGVKKQILLNLNSKGIIKSYLKGIPGINDSIIEDLIEKGHAEQKVSTTRIIVTSLCKAISYTAIPVKIIGWVCNKFGNLIIDYLSVSENLWDSHSPDYFLKKENLVDALSVDPGFLNNLSRQLAESTTGKMYLAMAPERLTKIMDAILNALSKFIQNYNTFVKSTIDKLYQVLEQVVVVADDLYYISETFAMLCGVWNGIVDFVGGILVFVGFLGEFNYDIYSDIDAFLERYDSFCETLSGDFWGNFWDAITESYASVMTYIITKDSGDFNWDKVSYITGYALAFIGTFFIPFADFAKPAEVAAKLKKAIVPVDLLSDISKTTAKAGSVLSGVGNKAATAFLEFLDTIIALMAKGKQALIDFFKPICDRIMQWLLKNKKVVILVDEIDTAISRYLSILQRNDAFLKCLNDVSRKNSRFLGQWIPMEYEAMIKLYTGSVYRGLNKALRGLGEELTKEYKAMQKVLDEALSKLPISEYNKGTLLRSARFSEAEINKLFRKGKTFIDKGFFSSTYSEEVLIQWMKTQTEDNVIFRIYGKNGKLIEQASLLPNEMEVLFKSGTEFVVENVGRVKHPVKRGETIFEIILRER